MSSSNQPSVDPSKPLEDPFVGTEYRAVSLLGSGGMGDVYVVEHRTLSHQYAAKLLREGHAADRRIVDRMRLEAHSLAKLRHPNIVQIDRYATTLSGLPFIVMELLHGRTLKDELTKAHSLPLNLALLYTIDLLYGLDAVHELGIVHRDIKPSNLFIHAGAGEAAQPILKMLDFGVARVIPGANSDSPAPLIVPTRTGTVAGTPVFVSPEAALGRTVDVRTDIYNAALVFYVMLTGRGPFDDLGSNEAIIKAHIEAEPPPPSRLIGRRIPQGFDEAILRGLAKNPADRFQSAADFAVCLCELGSELLATHKQNAELGSHAPVPNVERTAPSRESEPEPIEQIGTAPVAARAALRFPLVSMWARKSIVFVFIAALVSWLVVAGVDWSLR